MLTAKNIAYTIKDRNLVSLRVDTPGRGPNSQLKDNKCLINRISGKEDGRLSCLPLNPRKVSGK